MSNKLTNKERIQTLEINFKHKLERDDSHHYNTQQKIEKVYNKLENIPTEDSIFRMFSEEGEKLAKGILKQVDEAKEDIKDIKKEVGKAKEKIKDATNEINFAKRQGYVFAAIVVSISAIIMWFLDVGSKIKGFLSV